jgi:hypothetical protein
MTRAPIERSRYQDLRRGRRTLGFLASLVQFGLLAAGLAIFLHQAWLLYSGRGFTWGERQVLGAVALVAVGGCGIAGWVAGHLIKVVAELLDVLADGAEAASRTNELIERHVIPTLVRVATALESREPSPGEPHDQGHQ